MSNIQGNDYMIKNVLSKQIGKYLISGFTAFGIEYSLYLLLISLLDVYYVLASVIVYSIVFWFSFLINRIWTFKSKGPIHHQLFKYSLLFTFNLIFSNIVLMYLLTDFLGISLYLSPFIKMGFVVCWNFLFYKFVIFK